MDEAQKKPIMIGIVVVCLVAAGIITVMTRKGNPADSGVAKDETLWIKCNNPACKQEYEKNARTFYDLLNAAYNPLSEEDQPPGITCDRCGEPSAFRAEKCGNPSCGIVFFRGVMGDRDFVDRCPKCKFSAREEELKQREVPTGS